MSVSLPPFSSDKRKTCRRQGENTVNRSQAASTSADELKTQANSTKQMLCTPTQSIRNENKRLTAHIKFSNKKHQLTVDVQHHRKVFPNHQWLLAKPNRMFGLGSFGTWMCRKSRCVIKAIYYLKQKTIRCQSLCLLSLLTKRK